MTEANIYIGTVDALQAEIGLPEYYVGALIVAVFRTDGSEFEPIPCETLAEAKEVIAEYSAYLATLGEVAHVNWVR
jgi:hypothetical protein